jgi:hypothetical protein
MQFKNIAIVGTSIDGKGVLTISKLADKQTELSLNFSQINLDSMFDVNAEDDKTGAQAQHHNSKKMNFGNNMLAINIAVDSLTFGEVAYNEIKFSSALKEGNFSIHDFSGHSNQGEFKVIGEITQNSFRSIFDGKIYFNNFQYTRRKIIPLHYFFTAVIKALLHFLSKGLQLFRGLLQLLADGVIP